MSNVKYFQVEKAPPSRSPPPKNTVGTSILYIQKRRPFRPSSKKTDNARTALTHPQTKSPFPPTLSRIHPCNRPLEPRDIKPQIHIKEHTELAIDMLDK